MQASHSTRRAGAVVAVLVGLAVLGGLTACAGPQEPPPPIPKRDWSQTTVTVFPVVVRSYTGARADPAAAEQIAQAIHALTNAQTVVSSEALPFSEPWVDGAQGTALVTKIVAKQVQAQPLQTRFAVVAGYIVLDSGEAQRIDYFLTDAQGTVLRRLAMDRQTQMFVAAAPRTAEDCTKLLIQALRTRSDMLGN